MKLSRRDFLKYSAIASGAVVISTATSGCTIFKSEDENSENNNEVVASVSASFEHGVASGDPLSDKLIIWTRVTPENITDEVQVTYEISTDENFENIFRNGTQTVTNSTDFTLKVDVQDLNSGTLYYYRFKVNETISPIGKGKTLPNGDVEQVKFLVFSCANYTNGYFTAYEESANTEDIDVAIHLGDYIYEYGMTDSEGNPAYATENAETLGRTLPENNNTELLTLDDYRKRYALYKTDSSLQKLHQVAPMIAVWDDHEVTNDTYKDGAENSENFEERKSFALQAYFEWLPIRPIDNKEKIYRSFDFGNLVSLHMLETRLLARDKQLDMLNYYSADGSFDSTQFQTDLTDENRNLIGTEQLEWLQTQVSNSSATWQVLGQQVLMSRMNFPMEFLQTANKIYSTTDETEKATLLTQLNELITELVIIKMKDESEWTAEESARVTSVAPYNLDAWDGYSAERERVLDILNGKNFVVLAGDTHNGWYSHITDKDGTKIGDEFAVSSVSSPGLQEYLGLDEATMQQLESVFPVLVDDLKYSNLIDRGFLITTFTQTEAKAEWVFLTTDDKNNYTVLSERNRSTTVTK
jgi:alkaline phosphatase D